MSFTHQHAENLREKTDGREFQVPTFLRTVPMNDKIGESTDGTDIEVTHTTKYRLENNSILELWITAAAQDYAGGDAIEVKVYREDFTGVYSLVSTIAVTTLAATAGTSVKNLVTDSGDVFRSCTHYSVSGTFTVAANGSLCVKMGKLGAVAG